MRPAALAFALLLAPAAASAHELWVERSGGELTVHSGHRGGERLPIERAKVKAIRCAEGSGPPRELLPAARFTPSEVRVAGPCEAISVLYEGGFYSLTPDGEVNLPRSKAKDVVKAWESRQLAKWIDVRSPRAAAPLGDLLEIVPVTDLSARKAGDKATFKVLYQGKPVPGAVVAVDHKPLGETDSAGEVRIRLREAGTSSVDTSLRRPVESPDADALVLEASLTFEVPR